MLIEAEFEGCVQRPERAHRVHLAVIRVSDVVIASVLLIVLTPLLVALALAVRLHDGGPSLFWHTRVGHGGRRIRVPKFRTMHVNAQARLESDRELYETYVNGGYKLPCHADPRVSRLGRVLRKSSLDELPQLWNVVKGEMSLVGPRPVVEPELSNYADRGVLEDYLSMTPGLTGRWQVSGRSRLTIDERIALDVSYQQTLGQYVAILLRTPLAVVARDGAN